jgi:putative transposase
MSYKRRRSGIRTVVKSRRFGQGINRIGNKEVYEVERNAGSQMKKLNKKRDIEEPAKYPSISYKKQRKPIISNSQFGAKYKLDKPIKGVRPFRPLETVLVDHMICDVYVMDEKSESILGRPWLTMLIDEATRYPLGFHLSFSPPSYLSVIKALEHAVYPKYYVKKKYPSIKNDWDSYGIPEKLVVEDFAGEQLEDACSKLGITLVYSQKRSKFLKGLVERVFQLINEVFNPPLNSDEKEIKESKRLIIGLDQLSEIIHKWIVDYYAKDYIQGFGIPSIRWGELLDSKNIKIPAFKTMLVPLPREKREIQRNGINFMK